MNKTEETKRLDVIEREAKELIMIIEQNDTFTIEGVSLGADEAGGINYKGKNLFYDDTLSNWFVSEISDKQPLLRSIPVTEHEAGEVYAKSERPTRVHDLFLFDGQDFWHWLPSGGVLKVDVPNHSFTHQILPA